MTKIKYCFSSERGREEGKGRKWRERQRDSLRSQWTLIVPSSKSVFENEVSVDRLEKEVAFTKSQNIVRELLQRTRTQSSLQIWRATPNLLHCGPQCFPGLKWKWPCQRQSPSWKKRSTWWCVACELMGRAAALSEAESLLETLGLISPGAGAAWGLQVPWECS